MGALVRLLQLVGLNAIPLAGLFFAGWSPATALALYWCENVVGSALVAGRIAMHRGATDLRGHYRVHLGLEFTGTMKVAGQRKPVDVAPKTLLAEFVWATGAFSVGHGIFLAVLFQMMEVRVDLSELRTGLVAMVGIQLVGFGWDAWTLAARPFAWIKALAQRSLGRVMLVHLAILGGMLFSYQRPHPERFFLVFGGLKLLSDLASWLPLSFPPPAAERAANEADEQPRGRRKR